MARSAVSLLTDFACVGLHQLFNVGPFLGPEGIRFCEFFERLQNAGVLFLAD